MQVQHSYIYKSTLEHVLVYRSRLVFIRGRGCQHYHIYGICSCMPSHERVLPRKGDGRHAGPHRCPANLEPPPSHLSLSLSLSLSILCLSLSLPVSRFHALFLQLRGSDLDLAISKHSRPPYANAG